MCLVGLSLCQQHLLINLLILCTSVFQVDLLGDEVDALLRLLEKIYVALDHYYPVLKHYSGVSQIRLPGILRFSFAI